MNPFKLPDRTKVDKVIPKNAFDSYATSKQKKILTSSISRIIWKNKLSPETINLPFEEIQEIQIFNVEMKQKDYPHEIIHLIDKSIPYPIIFISSFLDECVLSTSVKHQNPTNPDNAIIDWHYKTDWFSIANWNYSLQLSKSLDFVYLEFCKSLNPNSKTVQSKNLNEMIEQSKILANIERKITHLQKAITKEQQFNKKVEMNVELNTLLKQKDTLLKS